MKKAIFVTVRTGSTRLPNKSLLEINGKKTIEYVIDRVKGSKLVDEIILCTTMSPNDDILCQIALEKDILVFRGSEKDKLDRWQKAASAYNIDFFISADGDDLFCGVELMDLVFEKLDKEDFDFIEWDNEFLPCGAFSYGMKVSALNKVCEIKDSDDTEMMWVYFTDTGLFKTRKLNDVPVVFNKPGWRLTLDYEDDLRFFEKVIGDFSIKGLDLSLRNILEYLDENPDVVKINQYLEEKYVENQKSKINMILKETE